MGRPQDIATVERLIQAPAEQIFALLADPTRHGEFDGSGTLQEVRGSTGSQLKLGDLFGMNMRWGIPYVTRNEVTELVPDRRIAWRTVLPPPMNRLVGGRTWRYELIDSTVEDRPATLVRETWDVGTEMPLTRPVARTMRNRTVKNMTRTLHLLEQITTS